MTKNYQLQILTNIIAEQIVANTQLIMLIGMSMSELHYMMSVRLTAHLQFHICGNHLVLSTSMQHGQLADSENRM